jgi:hypothetical protein
MPLTAHSSAISMIRMAALLLVIGGTLAASPAVAQFGNIFGDTPPRPPADIPNGPFPPQPPPPRYPDQAPPSYPNQAAPAINVPQSPPSAIESAPLPPPPGVAVARPPPAGRAYPPQQSAPMRPALATPPPHATAPAAANASPPPRAGAETVPPDDTVVERPTAHIDNGRAVFAGLDKISGRTITFDVGIGETVQFGALQVTPRACYTRPPTEATNTDAFVEVDEVTLQGEIKRIFTGWMFASSPGLHAVEHPIYDVWLVDCASPVQTTLAGPPEQSATAAAAKPHRSVPSTLERTLPPSGAPLD